MMNQKLKSITFLCLLLALNAVADEPIKSKMTHYSTEEGLSHDGVLCMFRDREGFMWFGTWDGINRFDGQNFVTYKARPGDRSILKNNKIRNILEAGNGFLWVKTYDNKVYLFNKATESFTGLNLSNEGRSVGQISIEKTMVSSLGDTWLITQNQGLISVGSNSDGKVTRVHQYLPEERGKLHIPSKQVNFLFEDARHKIWGGTDKGLFCLSKTDSAYRHFFRLRNGKDTFVPKQNISCADGNATQVYFGTNEGWLIYFDYAKAGFQIKKLPQKDQINAIKVTKSGLVYLATAKQGLVIYNPATKTFKQPAGEVSNTYLSIYEDAEQNLWLEPADRGIVKYSPRNTTFNRYLSPVNGMLSNANVGSPVYQVYEDVNGYLWAIIKGGGFAYFDREKDAFYTPASNSLEERQYFSDVINAYSDQTGVLWLCTRFGGVNKYVFPLNNFTTKTLVANSNNKLENEVRAVFEDRKKRLWVATKAEKLYVFDNGVDISAKLFGNINTKSFGRIYTITEAKDGSIWMGTKGDGLWVATSNTNGNSYQVKHYMPKANEPKSISSDMIYALLEDSNGRMWIGTFGNGLNLAVKKGGELEFLNAQNYFGRYPIETCNVIRDLFEDDDGIIWVATTDGLLRFDPRFGKNAQFHRTQKIPGDKASLGNNDIQYIYKDLSGDIWLGTFGGGLNKVIKQQPLATAVKFKVFTKEQGLSNDIVLNIIDDGANHLWMATEYGLSRFDKKTESFRNFDSYEGLPKEGFSEGKSIKLSKGALCFGGIDGYITFVPSQIKSNKFKAQLAFTNLQLFNHDVNVGADASVLNVSLNQAKQINLKYDQNVINIDYAVLDYRSNHSLSYAYILKGYDKQAHYVKNQTRAAYNRLPPGKYVFEVSSLNNDLFANQPSKSIEIIIAPPFWLTAWAYLVYLILAILLFFVARNIIITVIRLRNKVVLEHKLTELKLEFFTNISHELRTPLTLIINPLKKIAESETLSTKGAKHLNIVTKNADRMVRFVNQLLDFRKIQSGKMPLKFTSVDVISLAFTVAEHFKEIAEEKNITFVLEADTDAFTLSADEEKLDIVIYNLLSNAFKFTPAHRKITLKISCLDHSDFVTIQVIDEGIGVAENQLEAIFELYYEAEHQNQKGSGIGLALAKNIISSHNGKIWAQNNPVGMCFTVSLPKTSVNHPQPKNQAFTLQVSSVAKASAEDENAVEIAKDKEFTVLLVEDNNELRLFLADQLSEHYQVLQASDGVKGMEQAKNHLPDLVISDVMMPNKDGIALLNELKTQQETSHIPVILLTAKSAVENQIEALRYGADFYITKPFDLNHVLACVANLIKQRKMLYKQLLDKKPNLVLSPSEPLITDKDETFLNDVIETVEQGMTDPQFSIDAVALSMGLGRTTFYKKLKSLTQRSPVEFVRDIRLKRGKQLLDSGQHNVSEIAYMVGFSSSGYFATCFKEAYQVSPSEYLKTKK